MSDHKPKSGLPRWFPGDRFRKFPGWITLVVLTSQVAVVRRPGATTWEMNPKEWLALPEDRPDA